MKLPENYAKVSRLTSKLLDGELAEPGMRDLEELLREDPEARLLYLQYIDMQVEFMCLADPAEAITEIPDLAKKPKKKPKEEKIEKLPKPPKTKAAKQKPRRKPRTSPRRRRRRAGAGRGGKTISRDWWIAGSLAAAIAILLTVAFVMNKPKGGPEIVEDIPSLPAQPVSVDRVSGDVEVTRHTGNQEAAPGPGLRLERDDFIRVAEEDADAMLTYADGTRFRIVQGAAIRPKPGPAKHLELPRGDAWFSVTPQPQGQPMVIETPVAKVEVLGTEFLVSSSDSETQLEVTSGRVRLTRYNDGESIEVPAGRRLVAPRTGEFINTMLWDSDHAWREDFENGVPRGWKGQFVKHGLPEGSRGGIMAKLYKEKSGKHYTIGPADEWDDGLFEIHSDTHFHLVYKTEKHCWFNFMMLSRDDKEVALHQLKEDRFQEVTGKWRKAVIPLSKFERKTKDGFLGSPNPPIPGELVWSFFFETVNAPNHLVIDSMWVTRGGPGVAEFMTIE